MFHDPKTWVAIAFLIFVALLVYLKAPGKIAAMLDQRAADIAKQLAEAKRLREEAQALLDDYKRKRVEAERTAEDIVAQAKTEAEAYAAETHRKFDEALARRARQAEQKIAQAEAQAVKEVREATSDLAIAAAARLAGDVAKGAKGAKLIEESIGAVKTRLN